MAKKKTNREIKTESNKEKIIEVSLSLFRRYGFEKTSIQDICDEANVSVGSLYHLFQSKNDIVSYVLKDVNPFYNLDIKIDYKKSSFKSFVEIDANNFISLVNTLTPEVVYNAIFSNKSGNKTMFYKDRSNILFLNEHLSGFKKARRLKEDIDINYLSYVLASNGIGVFYHCYTMEKLDRLKDMLVETNARLLESYSN